MRCKRNLKAKGTSVGLFTITSRVGCVELGWQSDAISGQKLQSKTNSYVDDSDCIISNDTGVVLFSSFLAEE